MGMGRDYFPNKWQSGSESVTFVNSRIYGNTKRYSTVIEKDYIHTLRSNIVSYILTEPLVYYIQCCIYEEMCYANIYLFSTERIAGEFCNDIPRLSNHHVHLCIRKTIAKNLSIIKKGKKIVSPLSTANKLTQFTIIASLNFKIKM